MSWQRFQRPAEDKLAEMVDTVFIEAGICPNCTEPLDDRRFDWCEACDVGREWDS